MKKITLLVIATALMVSCADKKKKQDEPITSQEMLVITQEQTPSTSKSNSNEVVIELGSTDQMTFDKTELRVKEGQKVTLILKHIGNLPKTAMGHNFVLLKPGTNLAAFAQAAMQAKDTDYIPKMTKDVIANTKIIGGGETTSITFDAPEKGTYDYICSFPGHYAMMKGKFIVE